jgi:succinate-semialdehyde dehydrogenase / glutarate-semialdehyde dehydrogenase
MPLVSINPATESLIARYDEHTPEETDEIVERVHGAFEGWRRTPFAERSRRFERLADLLDERREEYARLIVTEMGKPIRWARAEIEKCALVCRHFAKHAEGYLAPETVPTEASKSYVAYQPLGAMLALMPWNFPFWQVFRFAAPALMAGNTALLKHANNVTGAALAVEALFRDAGFPENAFRTLRVDIPAIEAVIRNPRIQSVSLTGSTRAGQSVGATAGSIPKRCVLELGGSDPFVVLEDADLDVAIEAGVFGRLFANGQSCIASKRFIVCEPLYASFVESLRAAMEKVTMGDPMDEDIYLGPLARPDLRETLHAQTTRSVEMGARLVLGGTIPAGTGAYYPPTILADVCPGMPAYTEELFGPVAAVIRAVNEAEAIRIANDTSFGLGSTVCSRDLARAERIAREEIQAGGCFVNTFTRSDPRLPFGGIKGSGFGRELGAHGIRELCNVKTVFIQ